jgi:hypothetical protein
MPALPPMITTVCPRSAGSCVLEEAVVAVLMIPPITGMPTGKGFVGKKDAGRFGKDSSKRTPRFE